LHLAVYVRPLHEELLSSWMIRTCHANATSLYSLLWHFKWNNQAQTDIDQTQNTNFLRWLATTLNHPEGFSGVEAMSLRPIHELATLFPHKSWIRGIDRRAFKWRSFRFCPQCFQSDKSPYFRRLWRLEWHEVCPIHNITMPNGCLKCGAPVILHRVPWHKAHLAHCHKCGVDFRKMIPTTIDISNEVSDDITGLYALVSNNDKESYAAVHFLEAFIEQGLRFKGLKEPIQALRSIGINTDHAKTCPALFIATSAYQLWFKKRELLDDFIFSHQGWFNLAVRDYSCPDILKSFHRVGFRVHELNESIINQAANEILRSGWEPTPSRIARKIGCHVSRVQKKLNNTKS